jgi:hypothetical protein
LDLYLLGVKAAEEVAPFRLLVVDEEQDLVDCTGALLDETSPPQRCEPLSLAAQEKEFSIADVLEVEGARDPAPVSEPVALEVAFYFLSSEGVWTAEGCEHWEQEVAALEATFESATGGRMFLSNVVSRGPACGPLASLLRAPSVPATASWRSSSADCSLGGARRGVPELPLLVLCTAGLWSRRRHKKVPG